jgi:hypothetical protein
VDDQEFQRIQDRFEEQRITQEPFKVLQTDPLHRCDHIPSMEQENEGKDKRIRNKGPKKHGIWQHEPVTGPSLHTP